MVKVLSLIHSNLRENKAANPKPRAHCTFDVQTEELFLHLQPRCAIVSLMRFWSFFYLSRRPAHLKHPSLDFSKSEVLCRCPLSFVHQTLSISPILMSFIKFSFQTLTASFVFLHLLSRPLPLSRGYLVVFSSIKVNLNGNLLLWQNIIAKLS